MPSGVYKRIKPGHWVGKKRSKETIEKIRKKNAGKRYSPQTEFKKGHPAPKTAFKKGHPAPKTAFKKGQPSPRKGKKYPQYSGKNSPSWKGGKTKSQGYVYIWKPNHPHAHNNYVSEHRFEIEKQIGRPLKSEEEVHHLNEIRNDNRPKNLIAFVSQSAHIRFHRNPNKVKPSEIIFDGRKL